MPDYRTLVVDDNPSMRKLMGMVLTQLGGVHIDYAGNGLEAIKLHNVNRYDIIILDNAMPEMTGMEFLRAHHDNLDANNTAVIMVTAAPDQEMVKAARTSELRLHDIVVKPFDVQLMKERIQKIIDRYKAQGRRGRTKSDGEQQKSVAPIAPNLNGKMLSLGISLARNVVTVSMTGMFLNEDRGLINNFIKRLSELPGDTLLFDLSGVVGIDEFGLGTLLFANGRAAAVGKKTYLVAESSVVSERIKTLGIPEIVPMCGHWSDVAFDTRYNHGAPERSRPALELRTAMERIDGREGLPATVGELPRSMATNCSV